MTKVDQITKINRLYSRGLLTLGREMERLNTLSVGGKLSYNQGQDLRAYIKLLGEIKKAQEAIKAAAAAKSSQTSNAVPDEALRAIVAPSDAKE